MTFRPDYGLYLLESGFRRDMRHFFYEVPLHELNIINGKLFSIMMHLEVEGVEYAVSFDFPVRVFGEVVDLAPEEVRAQVRRDLLTARGWPIKITFKHPFSIGLEAKLGELQKNDREQFIPLVVERVFAA